MNKLIIRHGERVTEHSISDHPLVVGRDPQCDLFFADKKLSRRHARFERDGDRVRLVDLGSRNGCWVNEERVQEVVLSPDDAVRLGALAISLEPEPDASHDQDDQESTVFLTPEPSADDSRTVVLAKADLPNAEPPPDAGTVILPPADLPATDTMAPVSDTASPPTDPGNEDPTLRRDEPAGDDSEHTIVLQGERPRAATDTGTVIFRNQSTPETLSDGFAQGDDSTRIAAAPPAPPADAIYDRDVPAGTVVADAPMSLGEQSFDVPPPARIKTPSTARFVALVAAIAVLAFVVLALPLVRTLGSALTAESSLRGRALVDLLGAVNEDALRENRAESLSVQRVSGEPGVIGAYVLDPMGRVLVPSEMSGESLAPLFARLGIDGEVKDIRAFRETRALDDTTLYALPVRAQGRRLGVAVLHYRVGAAVSGWTATMLVLGSVLLLMGVATAVLLARRWTLVPVQELRDDVEALRRGFIASLAEDRAYSDLVMIARSFNELNDTHGPIGHNRHPDPNVSGDGSETFKPMVDPTLVPDEREQAEG